MTRTRKALSFVVPALVIGALSLLPETARTEGWRHTVLLPGMLVASLGWPQGAHSDTAGSAASVYLMFIVIYIASIAFWGAVIYLAQHAWLGFRRRRSVSTS